MELKYPDDEEKKNSICISFNIPETAKDYFISAQAQNKVEALATKELGLVWMRSRRCNDLHHLPLRQMVSFLWILYTKGQKVDKKFDMCVNQILSSSE